ncbi:MAG: transglycosylase SLT domain-containing protein [Rubrivivax sp.]|nr:transglycosylase SLT domain-containing protein [Rubrivivax sp.]
MSTADRTCAPRHAAPGWRSAKATTAATCSAPRSSSGASSAPRRCGRRCEWPPRTTAPAWRASARRCSTLASPRRWRPSSRTRRAGCASGGPAAATPATGSPAWRCGAWRRTTPTRPCCGSSRTRQRGCRPRRWPAPGPASPGRPRSGSIPRRPSTPGARSPCGTGPAAAANRRARRPRRRARRRRSCARPAPPKRPPPARAPRPLAGAGAPAAPSTPPSLIHGERATGGACGRSGPASLPGAPAPAPLPAAAPTAEPVIAAPVPAAAPAPSAPVAAEAPFSDETLAWMARAALRLPAGDKARWPLVLRTIEEMSAAEQRDPAWVYWRARAIRAGASGGPEGEGARALARHALESIAGPLGFYQQLALEELGQRLHLPAAPVPLVETEREPVRQHAGLRRALRLMSLGLRGEGVREWNYALRGMNDRELLAAAALACEREVWDRCIHTSERTRDVADIGQRYPLPFREAVLARAGESGVDAAYVYGLIRQESRFILDARSSAGAMGLMQLMPRTARWTARRAGLAEWRPELVTERDTNLLLGTTYLKLVLDEFEGAQAMGAAAYNAGPSRPRRWREGAVVEPAAWIEGIPFNETRDYVKKVLSNAVVYSARLRQQHGSGTPPAVFGPVSLRARLGERIGPRDPAAPVENRELP